MLYLAGSPHCSPTVLVRGFAKSFNECHCGPGLRLQAQRPRPLSVPEVWLTCLT